MFEGKKIEDFPEYIVTEYGEVFNAKTEREIQVARTGQGTAKVTLYRDGRPFTRALGLIVAKAYVWNDFDPDIFDTPIHLNHEPLDNRAVNLRWRPRWFAIKYAKQYWFENYHNHRRDIYDPSDGEVLPGVRWICEKHGVLWFDVLMSLEKGETVFPSGYRFTRA